jgi:hypothetical protein
MQEAERKRLRTLHEELNAGKEELENGKQRFQSTTDEKTRQFNEREQELKNKQDA